MLAANRGHIVTIASGAGIFGKLFQSVFRFIKYNL
jgi:short-subunit dehydrogenase